MTKKIINRKFLVISIVIIIFLTTGFMGWHYKTKIRTEDKQQSPEASYQEGINYAPATDQEKENVDSVKNTIDNPPATTPQEDRINISSIQQQPGGEVVVKTELYGHGWDQCTLTATNESTIITRSAEVLFQPTFSTCTGFVMSATDFPKAGQWSFSLKAIKVNGVILTVEKSINIVK